MEEKNKIWFNKKGMKIFSFILIVLTIIIVYAIIINIEEMFNEEMIFAIMGSGRTICFIIILAFLVFLWWIYILYIISKKGRVIKIKNFPYLKYMYKITLIPYDNIFKTNDLKIDENYFYRDLPCRDDLLLAYWISYQYKITDKPQDFIGAVLLKLIKENKINTIERDNNGYYLDITKIVKCEYEYEYMLLDIIKSAAVNGILKEQEFAIWCNNNYKSISSWYEYSLKLEEENLINQGLIKKDKIVQSIYFGQVQSKSNILVGTDEIELIAKKLLGLKKYLLSFSLIKEKQIIDVHLWEYYLIYAKIFGIADKVKNEFKDIYPDFIDLFDNLSVKIVSDDNGYIDIC